MSTFCIVHAPSSVDPFLIVYKPSGMPSAPLSNYDKDSAISRAIALFPYMQYVKGKKEIEHGLLHRIDTDAAGLVVIAATQHSYDVMIKNQAQELFIKTYRAKCDVVPHIADMLDGFCKRKTDDISSLSCGKAVEIRSHFRPFGRNRKSVRPVTDESGTAAKKKACKKWYVTTVLSADFGHDDNMANVRCEIRAGYRHQVRCHLAWIGLPVKGDNVYNINKATSGLCFEACAVEFPHPVTGKIVRYSIE